jgi:hypothetical protein
MSHTPGPWKASDEVDAAWVSGFNPNENVICDIVGRGYEADSGATIITDEDIDNANLIAAAPEMLEALERVLQLQISESNDEIFAEVRAAIAKAKGEDVPA